MQRYYFTLSISHQNYLRYYQGSAARVVVKAHDGRTVSLPAVKFRRFVLHDGIHGSFCLTVDDQQRFQSLERWPPTAPSITA